MLERHHLAEGRSGAGVLPEETEALACRADPGDHTYLVPAFTGIGAPYWDDGASACFVGMSRLTGGRSWSELG